MNAHPPGGPDGMEAAGLVLDERARTARNVFILIEMADVEIIGVQLFADELAALETFRHICNENHIVPTDELGREISGTMALAGDDAYSIQLVRSAAK